MSDQQSAIQHLLQTIATEEGVRILYACESGSRAWEFASTDSDYDIRFLYVRPIDDYLRIDAPRDVIERPIVDDLDVNGWDIFKALRLLRKSNPPLLEWLFSPIVYQEISPSIAAIRDIARHAYAAPALFYHYSRMAYGNYHQYIEQESAVPLKKYLYVLRPIIALLFVEQQQSLPPTSFMETMARISLPEKVQEHIEQLVAQKRAGTELGTGAPDALLNTFIAEHLGRWDRHSFEQDDQQGTFQALDSILHDILYANSGK